MSKNDGEDGVLNDLRVSIIIPAYNAAKTLDATLRSVVDQSCPAWEVIVVDDGSSDGTSEIAKNFADRGHPIRVLVQENKGVCGARNAGIGLARNDWLLFLDADDWIVPRYLERMLAVLAADASLDAVHCGSRRIAPDGSPLADKFGDSSPDLFPILTRHCPFSIHSCVMRKALVEKAGGFDASFRICEDWDLWQRIARAGARFGSVREVLALYRMRPGSLSHNPSQFYRDALRVLERGYLADPRVADPLPKYANGQPSREMSRARLLVICWLAGLMLGEGKDARSLLEPFKYEPVPSLDAQMVAEYLVESALLQECRSPMDLARAWPGIEPVVSSFLGMLEEISLVPSLARRTMARIERIVIEQAGGALPICIGTTLGMRLEVTEPLPEVRAKPPVDRLCGRVQVGGRYLGIIELPFCDGAVDRGVLADVIAARFSWDILRAFFEETIYPRLSTPDAPLVHDQIGWEIFLQQLFNRSDWPNARFYDPDAKEPNDINYRAKGPFLDLEASRPLPNVLSGEPELRVLLRVGGVPIGRFSVPVTSGRVPAAALRVSLLTQAGFELCVAAVREGLVGRKFSEVPSLNSSLVTASKRTAKEFMTPINLPDGANRLPGFHDSVVIGRRPGPIASSASRFARLPVEVAPEIIQSVRTAGEWMGDVQSPRPDLRAIIYAPGCIPPGHRTSAPRRSAVRDAIPVRHNDRNDFETLFARQPDPWKYTTAYEQTKYEQTLSLLPAGRVANAMEVGCAEGHFTIQLAAVADNLIAADISEIALERTRERCAALDNVTYRRIDITTDPLPGDMDLIVCSEVLYYVGDRNRLRDVANKFVNALRPGGHLLMAHANAVVDDPDHAGFDWDVPFGAKTIGLVFNGNPELDLCREISTPLYRIQLFQRHREDSESSRVREPDLIHFDTQPTALPPSVAARVLWNGGQPARFESPRVVTSAMPILMYHRIAPGMKNGMNPYRVSPEAFEQQLQYLRDTGFYSVGLEDWQDACATRSPLPGRAVILTFDDGYQDFFDFAAPLLQRYGFSATVFLVSSRIGSSNVWDQAFAETLPLMGWAEIRELQARGFQFGSHGVSHRPLTALSITEVVREGAVSRSVLEDQLRVPVRAIAYPYGDFNSVVEHLMGACGYLIGASCRTGRGRLQESLLSLPRIEIEGTDSLSQFVAKLAP